MMSKTHEDFLDAKTKKQNQYLRRMAKKQKVEKLNHKQILSRNRNMGFVQLLSSLTLVNDKVAAHFIRSLFEVMENPNKVLDFQNVTIISIRAGLILKGFKDEFIMKHGYSPQVRKPKNPKSCAVLQYLSIQDYGTVCAEYPDIVCWRLYDWDNSKLDPNEDLSKRLVDTVIPECFQTEEETTIVKSEIASAIAEALFNCKEHAYAGEMANASFQKWYLGFGKYPENGEFQFCIYDKGQGFRKSLEANPLLQDIMGDLFRSDSALLEMAVKGRTGVDKGKSLGRGKGLQSAVGKIYDANGWFSILSGKGEYTEKNVNGYRAFKKNRKTIVEGALIAFSLPISYIKDECTNNE